MNMKWSRGRFFVGLLLAAGLLGTIARAQGPTPKFIDATGADNFKLLFITKAKSPPTLDGKLEDACWKDVEPLSDFGHCEYNFGARRCAFPKTEVRYLWDDRYLYVAITCYEDTPDNMARHIKAVEDKSRWIFERDCVELHINGNNDNATRFQTWFIDTGEKQIFWHYDFGWGILVNESYGLTADWDYASFRGSNYWQTEGRFALADIQVQPRVGYIFGMNPCRFRFGKNGTQDDGHQYVNGEISQFLSWSTQGGDHHDVRLYGKCVLVDTRPASVKDGLKLAYPDLDKRVVMVQTADGFEVFDHGAPRRQSYLEKVNTELTAAHIMAKQVTELTGGAAPAGVDLKAYANNARPHFDRLAGAASNLAGRATVTVAEMGALRKEIETARAGLEYVYWDAQRALLLAEGTPRVTVDLKPSIEVPAGRDEPTNTPDPDTRKTTYVPWAKNCIGGKTTALIVTVDGAAWDAYELKRRMDLEAEIFYITGAFGSSLGPTSDYYKEGLLLYPQKEAQLERLLAKQYEAYIFLNCTPNAWPKNLQYVLTQRVLGGASLVVFQSQDWSFPGLPGAKTEKDSALGESIPGKSMTRLVPSEAAFVDHRGMPIDTLGRKSVPIDLPPVSKMTVGKGRYFAFSPGGGGYWFTTPLSPHFEQDSDELFQAEYYLGLDTKIILAAVGKLPARRLLSVDCGPAPLAPGVKATASAATTGPVFAGTLRVVTRDQWGHSVDQSEQDVKLPDGPSPIALPLPALGAGNYYVEAWLFQGDKVVDWAAQRFRVQGKAAIQKVQLAATTLKEGDPLHADVTVSNAADGATIRADVRDVHGRITERQANLPLRNGKAQIDLVIHHAANACQQLDVVVEQGGVAQDYSKAEFYVRPSTREDFTVFTDGEMPGRFGALQRQILLDFGVTLFENQGNPEDILGSGGALSTRYWLSGSANETGGSLASDVYHKEVKQTFQKVAQIYATRNTQFVSTGDDSGVSSDFADNYPNWVMPLVNLFAHKYPLADNGAMPKDFFQTRGLSNYGEYWRWLVNTDLKGLLAMKLQPGDFELFLAAFKEAYPDIAAFNRANGTTFAGFDTIQPEDLAKIAPTLSPDVIGFQDWLGKKYGKIEALNAAWGAEEKSFETIRIAAAITALTAQGKYAAALDKQAYLEDLFIRHMESAATAVHSVDPTIGIGQGAASFNNVIPEVLEYTDTFAPYIADVNVEIGRSMPHKWVGQTMGVYGGKAVKVPGRRQQAWHVLFSGGNFIWFWSACTGGLMGDLTTNPNRSGAMLETIHEIQQGIGACLLRGKRLHDGIAILHSRASGHMSGVVKEMSTQGDSETAFQGLVEDLGMQYRYVSTKQVENGALRGGEFKVLMLPYTQIVTAKETAEIEAFVKGGGTIIADLRAGTFSPDGKPLNPGALDTLFGITRSEARAKSVRGALAITGLSAEACSLDGFQADGSVKAGTAKPFGTMGDTPVLLVNDAGKGKAVLLNIGAGAYGFLLNRNALGAGRAAFGKLFELAGAKPRFRVMADGKDIPGVEMAVFKRDTAEYLTVEKRSFEFEKYPLKADIVLDGKYYVTDMRSGKSLGQTDRIPIRLEGLSCHVYSLLPYKVEGVAVAAPKRVKPGEDLTLEITLKTSATPAPHVIRVEAVAPDGTRPHELRKLDTQNGKATCILPMAFNDIAGTWTVTATDLASGSAATAKVQVGGK